VFEYLREMEELAELDEPRPDATGNGRHASPPGS
jgi:hypothetical protein